MISYYWENDDSVGKHRWINLISQLRKYSYDITVLTFSDRDSIKQENNYTLIEKKISSFNNFLNNNSIKSFSKGVLDSSNNPFISFLSWIRVNFIFPDGRILFYKNIENFIVNYINEKKVELLITTSPPHSIQLLGMNVKKRTTIKWISDFRDPYLNWDILLSMNPTYLAKKIHSSYQSGFIKNSDRVIVTNSKLKNEFKSYNKNNVSFIHNGSAIKQSMNKDKNFIISYFGLLNKFRNPKVFIDVLENILNHNKEFQNKFEFHLYGNIQKTTINYIQKKECLSIKTKVFKSISSDNLSKKISSSSLLLLLLNNIPNQNTTPYKLFDYLVSEKQILTLGDYKNTDVDYFLKKYKRFNRLGYGDTENIKLYINKSFKLYQLKKPYNINCDYSELRYKNLCKHLINIINS